VRLFNAIITNVRLDERERERSESWSASPIQLAEVVYILARPEWNGRMVRPAIDKFDDSCVRGA
jgi:hypothetical protein